MTERPGKPERHRRIIAELRANPTVRISDLADEFSVSTETVRRDIDDLSSQGLVNRTYGGAAATSMGREPAVHERGDTMVAERDRIARRAVTMIQPGDVVMVDAGSTTIRFAQRLAVEGIEATVITNALGVASALANTESIKVILAPGEYVGREHAVYGQETSDFLAGFHADHAIIGASGLTIEGVTDVDSHASWVKRAMLARAERRILLVDHGKFDHRSLQVVCPLGRLDILICDVTPPPALAENLRRAGVQVTLA